jgi:hypothetical protein
VGSRIANITAIPAMTTASATRMPRRPELEVDDTAGGVANRSADGSDCCAPHLHSPTRLGTRRPHDGHVHERFGEACSMKIEEIRPSM